MATQSTYVNPRLPRKAPRQVVYQQLQQERHQIQQQQQLIQSKPATKKKTSSKHVLCSKCGVEFDDGVSEGTATVLCQECRRPAANYSDDDDYENVDPKATIKVKKTLSAAVRSISQSHQDPTSPMSAVKHLHYLLTKGNLASVRPFLLKLSGAEQQFVVTEVINGRTALYLALARKALLLVSFMLEDCGADPNQFSLIANVTGKLVRSTCLNAAASDGNLDAMNILVLNDADVNLADEIGWTPLRTACYKEHVDAIKYLINNGANINIRTNHLDSCLLLVTHNAEILDFLISRGGEVNTADGMERTALHYAAAVANPDSVRLLLKNDAYVNAQDEEGNTPLHDAISTGNIQTMKVLIDHRADPYIRNEDREDAFLTASLKMEPDKVEYLMTVHKLKKLTSSTRPLAT